MRFLDTNVLIYAFGTDERAEIAQTLVAEGGFIAIQSLNEFTDVWRRKFGKNWPEIDLAIKALLKTCTLFELVGAEVQAQGRSLAERYRLRIFDAMLAATAIAAGCETFVSEDLQAGLKIEDRLTVVNPFIA